MAEENQKAYRQGECQDGPGNADKQRIERQAAESEPPDRRLSGRTVHPIATAHTIIPASSQLDIAFLVASRVSVVSTRADVFLRVVEIRRDKVRLGIEAPKEVTVHRREVYEKIKQSVGSSEAFRKDAVLEEEGDLGPISQKRGTQ